MDKPGAAHAGELENEGFQSQAFRKDGKPLVVDLCRAQAEGSQVLEAGKMRKPRVGHGPAVLEVDRLESLQ